MTDKVFKIFSIIIILLSIGILSSFITNPIGFIAADAGDKGLMTRHSLLNIIGIEPPIDSPLYSQNNSPSESEYVFVAQTPRIPAATPTPIYVPPKDPTSPIPDDYYTPNEDVSEHFTKDEKLFRYLSYYHWDHNTRYTMGDHDCSQQAARIEHDLKNAGVDCFIRTGINQYGGHAWVMIMYDGEYVAYESTHHPYFDESCFFVFPPSSTRKDDLYTSRGGKIKHDNSYYEEGYVWDILTDYDDMYDVLENFEDDLIAIGWENGKYEDQFMAEWGWWIGEDDYNTPWNDLRN